MARDTMRRQTAPSNNDAGNKSRATDRRRHTTFDSNAEETQQRSGNNGIHKSRRSDNPHRSPLIDISKQINIQAQIEGYEQILEENVNKQFASLSAEISQELAGLTELFNEKCTVLDQISNLANTPLEEELIDSGDDNPVTLGQLFTAFKEEYDAKKNELHGYWNEYTEIQAKIMELVIVLAEDGMVEQVDEEKIDETQESAWKLDVDGALARRESYRTLYERGLEELEQLSIVAFEEKESLIQEARDGQADAIKRNKTFKESMRKCLLALEAGSESDEDKY